MRRRAILAPLLLASLLILMGGCGSTPPTPEAARAVAAHFVASLAARDDGAVYALLTEAARRSMDRESIAQYLSRYSVTYESVGGAVPRETGWAQAPVLGLVVTEPERTTRWSELPLTLHYEGGRWRVAWVEPLLKRALLEYEASNYIAELELGRTVVQIDPYHYRGYLEQHFANRGLNRLREAEWWLVRAKEVASAAQQPDVYDAQARFKLSLGSPEEAIRSARLALELATPLIPATYSRRWEADTLVVLARAQFFGGDRRGAEATAVRAAAIDPQNSPLAVLRMEMRSTPTTEP